MNEAIRGPRVSLVVWLGILSFLCSRATVWTAAPPSLGTAQQFGVLGNSGVTGSTAPGTVVNGDVGSYPTATITNFPPSRTVLPFVVHGTADAIVQQAHANAKTAYDFLAAQGGTPLNDALSLNGIIAPGVYSLGAADLSAGTTLTLNGSGIFIFNVATTLTLNSGSIVTGSASPCNVYWRVGTSATLNGSSLIGTVIADAGITVGGGNVIGRVLAGTGATGAVTMTGGDNTIGGCSVAAPAPTVAKAFSPSSILAGGVSRLTVTLSNPNPVAIGLNAAFTDTLPSGVLIAAASNLTTTCGGAATAPAGGSTVTLPALSLIPSGSCSIAVNVTAPAAGTFLNTIPTNALQTTSGNNVAPASATLTATACGTITIAPSTMPPGRLGVAYSQQLTASGGTGASTFTVTSGALPAGLTLTPSGLLSGMPTTVGSSTVTIRVADINGCPAVVTYTIVVAAATCPVITLTPSTMPAGRVGVIYSQQITASGGTGASIFSVTSGALPAGLTLTPSGLLSGTPTTASSSTVTIQVADANGCPAVVTYTIVVAAATCPVITLTPSTMPSGRVGVTYSQQITASGGTGASIFSVTSGALPAGLTLTPSGLLSGTPTAVGSSTVTIQVADANGCPAVVTYTIVVAAATCPVITLAPSTMPAGRVGVTYSQQITASGGTGASIFSVISGALPAGLTLTPSGLLSGTPTAVGSSTVTIQVADANGCPAVVTYTIVVAAATCPVITLAPSTMPVGRVGVTYSQQITASGGTGTSIFSVITGALPAGLTLTPSGLLSGTPTAVGSSTVTIQVADVNGCPAVVTYTIVVAAATCPVITLMPLTMPAGRLGVTYSQQITARGGTDSSTFTVTSGVLPAGLTLTPSGLLSGTPTTAGSSTVAIQVADGNGCPAVVTYTIVVAAATCPVITVAPPTLPTGIVGVAYSQQITASGGSGSSTFSLTAGALPAGLTLTASGLLSGTPTTAATASTVTIEVTDGNGCPGVVTYALTIATAVPTLPLQYLVALFAALSGVGYFQLRRRPRA